MNTQHYKQKYLKYKQKYLSALRELKGGGLYEDGMKLLKEGKNKEAIDKFKEADEINSWAELIFIFAYGKEDVDIDYTQVFFYKDKLEKFGNMRNPVMSGVIIMCNYYGIGIKDYMENYQSYKNDSFALLHKNIVFYPSPNKYYNHMMGIFYRDMQYYPNAIYYFNLAHQDNHDISTYELGKLYSLHGDFRNALLLQNEAAKRGYVQSIFECGELNIEINNIPLALIYYNRVSQTKHDLAELSKIKYIFFGGIFTQLGKVKVGPTDRFVIDLSNIHDPFDSTPSLMMNELFNILKTINPDIIGHAVGSEFNPVLKRLGFTQEIYPRNRYKEVAKVDLSIAKSIKEFGLECKQNETLFVFSGDGNDRLAGRSGSNPKSIYNLVKKVVEAGKNVVIVSLYTRNMSENYKNLSLTNSNCHVMSFADFLQNVINSPFAKMEPFTATATLRNPFLNVTDKYFTPSTAK
jgi:tetratricopeptide (TPR) repeat protein